jgi:hypothetical protein
MVVKQVKENLRMLQMQSAMLPSNVEIYKMYASFELFN